MEERSKTNFDHPDSLETDLLIHHLQELKAGKIAVLPTYEFKTHARTPVTTMVRFSSSSFFSDEETGFTSTLDNGRR